MRVGILGAGVIGERRMQIIAQTKLGENALVFDTDRTRCQAVAAKYGARTTESALALIEDPAIQAVVIATPNALLAEYGAEALKRGKHVLIEKPGAIGREQIAALSQAQKQSGAVAKIGYNHRFHRAALALHEALQNPEHGKLMWVRGTYGHGGRPGYEKEWRFQRALSGGGEIIDQGVHLLDLLLWYGGRFELSASVRQNAFYRSSEDDNGFLILRSPEGAVAQLHCSATQWKNLFRWEIATEHSLFVWDGLGNPNYGAETLTTFRRNPAGGAPQQERADFGMCGMESWEAEWRHFYDHMTRRDGKVYSSLEDSQWVFQVLSQIDEGEVTDLTRLK